MKCDNCPYKLNGDCQVWYMNGVSFSCNGIRSQVFIETNMNVSADIEEIK